MSDGTPPRREDIDLTERAIEQHRPRSRPAPDHAGARAELAPLVPNGEMLSAAPNWVRAAGMKPFYLVIGDRLELPRAEQNGCSETRVA